MQAIYYEQFGGPIELREVPEPSPTPRGVVLKVLATGLCRSDWHGWMGHDPDITLPHVPGHELAGEVVAVGREVKRWRGGERVTLPFVGGCGVCPECLAGQQQVCPEQFQPGFTHWGSFAEYVAIDYADVNLVALPEEIDAVTAASLGCRFATAFRAIVDQGHVQGGQWVAVHGCGGVGLSAIMIARGLGAQVIAIDIDDEKLRWAEEVGAIYTLNAQKIPRLVEAVRDLSGGGAHVSLDALGHPDTLYNSIANLRRRGRHIQVGLLAPEDQPPAFPVAQVIAHELEILGSHGMQAHRYPAMLEMILTGQLQPDKLVRRTITLAEAVTELPRLNEFPGWGMQVIRSER
ncbi:MAG: zinc-dependent alcohol dehydrogenase family protein [Lewinella sp.]|nr:zinc-dependent alcohol dehydrogenase family protein [Lewinella sp.]